MSPKASSRPFQVSHFFSLSVALCSSPILPQSRHQPRLSRSCTTSLCEPSSTSSPSSDSVVPVFAPCSHHPHTSPFFFWVSCSASPHLSLPNIPSGTQFLASCLPIPCPALAFCRSLKIHQHSLVFPDSEFSSCRADWFLSPTPSPDVTSCLVAVHSSLFLLLLYT